MKATHLISAAISLLLGITAQAQQPDTVFYERRRPSILESMPSRASGGRADVTITQSDAIRDSLKCRIDANETRPVYGYRIRIFFSNAQNAREASSSAAELCAMNYPDYPVYRSFANPNFKVTVGDFLSRSDALKLLSILRKDFPAAFIVRESIN